MQGWDLGSCPHTLKMLSLHLSSAFHCVVPVLRHTFLLRQQSDFSRSRLRFHPPFHLIVNTDSFHHQNLSFTHNSSTEMAGRKPCSRSGLCHAPTSVGGAQWTVLRWSKGKCWFPRKAAMLLSEGGKNGYQEEKRYLSET